MRFPAAAVFLAVVSTTDAASFFKSSPPPIAREYSLETKSVVIPPSRENGWFVGVRGGATAIEEEPTKKSKKKKEKGRFPPKIGRKREI